jgi:uncharacterized membrane protein
MKKNRFDWFLMILFLINTVLVTFDSNYVAALGWASAVLTLGRILLAHNE